MCSSQRGELTNKILGVKGLNRVFLIGTLGNVQRTVLRICVLMLGSKGSRRLGIWELLVLVTSHSHHFFRSWHQFVGTLLYSLWKKCTEPVKDLTLEHNSMVWGRLQESQRDFQSCYYGVFFTYQGRLLKDLPSKHRVSLGCYHVLIVS